MKERMCSGVTISIGTSPIYLKNRSRIARQVAHRVIFMDEGSLVETGNPHDFFANPKTDRAVQSISKILTH